MAISIADELAGVGPRIRSIRTQQRMTLADVEHTTGISESTLSRLERGQRRPTLELLLTLARGFGVPLDDLVAAPPALAKRRSGSTAIPLTKNVGDLEAYKMLVPARDPDAVIPTGTHTGFMWLYVLAGRVTLTLGTEQIELEAGEVAEFDTRVSHSLRNPGPGATELLTLFGPRGERIRVRARTEPKS
jgi:transcriptional regulator with XRE-family HTH domain